MLHRCRLKCRNKGDDKLLTGAATHVANCVHRRSQFALYLDPTYHRAWGKEKKWDALAATQSKHRCNLSSVVTEVIIAHAHALPQALGAHPSTKR
jgi:hypothetical protein